MIKYGIIAISEYQWIQLRKERDRYKEALSRILDIDPGGQSRADDYGHAWKLAEEAIKLREK